MPRYVFSLQGGGGYAFGVSVTLKSEPTIQAYRGVHWLCVILEESRNCGTTKPVLSLSKGISASTNTRRRHSSSALGRAQNDRGGGARQVQSHKCSGGGQAREGGGREAPAVDLSAVPLTFFVGVLPFFTTKDTKGTKNGDGKGNDMNRVKKAKGTICDLWKRSTAKTCRGTAGRALWLQLRVQFEDARQIVAGVGGAALIGCRTAVAWA